MTAVERPPPTMTGDILKWFDHMGLGDRWKENNMKCGISDEVYITSLLHGKKAVYRGNVSCGGKFGAEG